MKNRNLTLRRIFHSPVYAPALIFFLLSYRMQAQNLESINTPELTKGEAATCEIKITNASHVENEKTNSIGKQAIRKKDKSLPSTTKSYLLQANEFGFFDQLSGIKPNQKIPVQISYPAGKVGEKVAIILQDGGSLDNGKKVKVAQIDNQKKITFDLQITSNTGLYRVLIRKGNDAKTVQLWVGPELPISKNKQ